jgi:transposase
MFMLLLKENVVRLSRSTVEFYHHLPITDTVTGAKLIYLPPYLPDFNPIEQAFHSVKAWLRRHEAEAIIPEARPWLIQQAALSITVKDAEGWILNSGYSFVV